MTPGELCDRCDGCGARFTIEHGLQCKKGGLVGIRHDGVGGEAGSLGALALSPSRVSYEPLIFYGTGVAAGQGRATRASATANGRKSNVAGDEARGDVMVHGLWKRGEDCVIDVRITETDAKSYRRTSSAKVLARAAK